jgi:hypothetical protein
MRESDPARKSTFDLLLGERTVGRPKRRWIEEVERDLKEMRIGNGWHWKGINGRTFWMRPRPKLGCRANERENVTPADEIKKKPICSYQFNFQTKYVCTCLHFRKITLVNKQ